MPSLEDALPIGGCAAGEIPLGSAELDAWAGVFGPTRPVRRTLVEDIIVHTVEIFGTGSSGKTTLVYHILAEAQKLGGVCAFIDAEHAMDPLYAQRIGLDIDELLVSQPDYGEQALEIVDMLIRSGAVDVIAIDSVAALTRARSSRARWATRPSVCRRA